MNVELTIEESILLYDAVSSQINSQFELWLTISFAVIIASYVAGQKLSRPLQYLVATLYILVSALLFAMLITAVGFASGFQNFGVVIQDLSGYVRVIAILRTIIWVLGTVTTVVFIFKGNRDA